MPKTKKKNKCAKAPNPIPLTKSLLKSGRFRKVKAVRVRRKGRSLLIDVRE